MSDKAWIQFLLVGGAVLSLIGSWMALRAIGSGRDGANGHSTDKVNRNRGDEGRTTNRVGDE